MSTITGTVTQPVAIGNGTYGSPLTIAAGAEVSLSGAGTAISSASLATLVDYGAVYATSSGGIGVDLGAGGYAGIGTSGRVEGYGLGIEIAGAAGTVTNAGTIAASAAAGFGIDLAGGGTLIDSGTVEGTTAIAFGGTGDNRLELDPLDTISGIAYAQGTQNVLELLSTGNAGTISGLGSAFAGFQTIAVDLGATWTLTGDNTLGAGVTLIDSGTLVNDGALFTDGGTLIVDPPDPPGSTIAGTVLGSVTITSTGSYASPLTIAPSGAVLTASGYAVYSAISATLVNDGRIAGGGSPQGLGGGVDFNDGGSIENQGAAATISGYDDAIYVTGTLGALTNTGTIEGVGTTGIGIVLEAGGNVYNAGLLSGSDYGIVLNGSGGTIVDSGTIEAISFGGTGNDLLLLETGYRFVGGIRGAVSGQNTLALSGSLGAVASTYSSLGLSNFGTLAFGGDGGNDETFITTDTGALQPAIENFANPHDIFDLRDLGAPGTYHLVGNLLTVTGSSGYAVMRLDGSYAHNFVLGSDGHGGTEIEPACFARGTRLLTERGERPVESLQIGDRVVTRAGVLRPIKWIGRRSYKGAFLLRNSDMWPICVGAGALGPGVPRRALYLSAKHALYFADGESRANSHRDGFAASLLAKSPAGAVIASEAKQSRSGKPATGVLVPVECLVNGRSIVRCRCPDEIEYFHIELESHDLIFAEGAPAETFVDCDSRGIFHNADEFALLYPGEAPPRWAFCAPRVEKGPALELLRRRLSARAGGLRLAV